MEVEGSEEGEGEVEETGQGRKTKTGRNVRFSHDENCVLVHNIIPCYEVILGNLAARTPLRRRHQLWGRVCEAVNAVGPLKRTVAHCRKRFSDIKRRLKEKMAQERRSTRRTGGGPPLRMEYTTYEEELRQIMPAEIVEGINVQDTDSPSFGQVVDSPGPQFSPSARPTPPPSARDSGTDEQAGPSSYQPPQAESLEMSPEPEDQTTITLVTVDAPVSGLQEVSPGPAEPSHHQPAPESMDPAREMALSIGAFQQQQTLFMDRQTRHMSQIAAQSSVSGTDSFSLVSQLGDRDQGVPPQAGFLSHLMVNPPESTPDGVPSQQLRNLSSPCANISSYPVSLMQPLSVAGRTGMDGAGAQVHQEVAAGSSTGQQGLQPVVSDGKGGSRLDLQEAQGVVGEYDGSTISNTYMTSSSIATTSDESAPIFP
ncbi:uncharacterized protein LOC142150767 [Mixophyes fleayi]|uniref:uncharacterized protein LOC142150767 n=1 Tax=Mixophyes fleayi TaxID=3061075 RepID=UPI003F4D8EBD